MYLLLYVHVCVTRTGWKTRPRPKTVILPIKKSINQSLSVCLSLPVSLHVVWSAVRVILFPSDVSACLSVCLPSCRSAYLPACLSAMCLFVRLPAYLPVCPSVGRSACVPVSICLSLILVEFVCQCLCLCLCAMMLALHSRRQHLQAVL